MSDKKLCRHRRCECTPDCRDCVFCGAKFERVTVEGVKESFWVVVPETIQ